MDTEIMVIMFQCIAYERDKIIQLTQLSIQNHNEYYYEKESFLLIPYIYCKFMFCAEQWSTYHFC